MFQLKDFCFCMCGLVGYSNDLRNVWKCVNLHESKLVNVLPCKVSIYNNNNINSRNIKSANSKPQSANVLDEQT